MIRREEQVFAKLNLKAQTEIVVLNPPESFEAELAGLSGVSVVRDLEQAGEIDFCLAFVVKQAQLDALAARVTAKARGDAVLWFAYPKASSKKHTCDFNRDTGWSALGNAGFEGVRQVDRRGLVRPALPARRLHQVPEAGCETGRLPGGQAKDRRPRGRSVTASTAAELPGSPRGSGPPAAPRVPLPGLR